MLLNYFPASLPVSFFSHCRFFLVLLSITLLSACVSDSDQDPDTNARTIPKNVTLTTGTRINELNWSGVSGARGYTVYWSITPGVTPTTGTAIYTQQPTLEHRGLTNGTTYYYVITSDTDFGQSPPSVEVEGTPQATPPARPDALTLKAGNGRITLRWDAVPGATHYTLYWKNHANVNADTGTTDARITQVTSPFVHPGLENGQTYFYRLVAENAHGASDASAEHSATPSLPLPSAPQITQANVASGQVTLHWQHTGIARQYELYWSTEPLSDNATENNAPLTQVTSPYTHTPLLNGQTYYYRVRTRNGTHISALSNSVQVTPPGEAHVTEPGAVPTAPTGITVRLENGQLSLNWPPVDGASGYNLYWTTDETGEITRAHSRITQIQPPYTHIHLNNGTRYRYRLSAFNDHGESALSTEVNDTPQIIIPGVPTGVQALAGDTSILVRWNPVQGATSYTLTLNDGPLTNTFTDVSSPHSITGLNNGTAYQIQLQAQNIRRLSDPSEPITATPQAPVPNTPNNLVARPGDAEILLQWTAALPQDANDPAETITAYRVYYATRPGVRPNNGTLINATPTRNDDGRWQLRHTALQNGQRYYYVVSAQNAGGEGGPSQEVWARPQAPTPGIITSLSAAAGDGQVQIDFTPLGNNEALTYNLYWNQALGDNGRGKRSPTEVISNIQPGYRFSSGPNTNGTHYFFRISAVNDSNEGPLSGEISATPQIPAPRQAPQNAQALTDSGQVTLNWSPVAQASGYVIYWATEPDISPQTSNRLSGDTLQPGFVHGGLDNGQSYFYRIAAINAGGESALSVLLAAQPQPRPPASPTGFTVQPGDGQVIINFALSPTATGYRVFWHPDVEAPLAQWSSRTLQPGDTLTDLDNTQTYYYRLQAYNAGGSSPLTAPVSATPQPNPPATPTGLASVTGNTELNNTLNITWHTQPGLRYTLYWSDDPQIAPRNSGNVLSNARPTYRHTGLKNDTTYYYQVSASNSGGESLPSAIMAIVLNIPNQAPEITQGATTTITLDEDNTPIAFALNATDNDGNTLTWSIATPANRGTVQINSNNTSAEVTYTPQANVNGSDAFIVQVSDGQGGSDSIQINITPQPATAAFVTTWKTDNPGGSTDDQIQIKTSGGGYNYTIDWGDGQTDSNVTGDITHTYATAGTYTVSITGDFPRIISESSKLLSIEQWGSIQWQSMNNAFAGCRNLVGNASDVPDLSQVTDMTEMFRFASAFNQDISTWDVSAVTRMSGMFNGASAFNQDIGAWDVSAVTTMEDMFTNITLSLANYDALLLGWSAQSLQSNVTFDGGNSQYSSSSQAARDTLTETFGWLVTDGGLTPGNAIPTQPQNVQGSTGNGQNTLQWQVVTGADQYIVQWSTQADMSDPQNTTVSTPSFVHESPPASILYYQIIAQNSNGDSLPSTIVEIVQDIPNQAPQITQGATTTVTLDEDSTPIAFALTLNATDNDGNTLTWTIATPANRGTAQINSNNTSAEVSYTPQANVDGSDVFTVQVNDGQGGSDSIQINVSITPQNDAPTITNTNLSLSIEENTTAVTAIAVTDIDNTEFTYALSGVDSPLFSMVGNTLNFIAAPDFENPQQNSGNNNVYIVSVTANDGTDNSAAKAFTITVTDVDDSAPVITLNGANTVTLIQGDTYVDAGASATDDRDGSVAVITSGSVDTSTIGTYTIIYSATDTAGNTSTATRTVTVNAATAFITTWKTDNSGIADNQIQIKTSGGGYNYTVDWGDGQTNSNVAGDITHTYATAGTYTVSITGDFPRIISDLDTDAEKLLSIEQWGSIQWQSMSNAFFGCRNLVGNASDVPDLSQVTDMSGMFSFADDFNQDISSWDVSAVTNMNAMFLSASTFNQNLNTWDVSAVTDMARMFYRASTFNQDLSSWDVSAVTYMSVIFGYASAFNQDLSSWDVSAVTNISGMFSNTSAFNQDLSSWDVSAVTNMNAMFFSASAFNQDLSNWDVSAVTDMSSMFGNTSVFNQNLNTWDVSAVTNMRHMFDGASAFNQNLSAWNVSSVREMDGMFTDVTLTLANYDALLLGWSAQSLQSNVTFSGGNSQYSSSSQAARDTLTEAFGWTVTDGGVAQ